MEGFDVSGFIDDTADVSDPVAIPVADNGNFRISRVVRHGRWWAAKSSGDKIDVSLGRVILEKEFNLLIRLNHPRIVRAVEFVDLPGLGWSIIMEWVDGMTLSDYLVRRSPGRRERYRLTDELLDVMSYVHEHNFTHRDLKPSNVIVDDSGHICLIDFGLADDPSSCLLKNVSGTVGYVAPELVGKNDDTDIDWRRADVYAIGLMMRLLGRSDPAGYMTINKCLNADAGKRPSDVVAVRSMLSKKRAFFRGAVVMCILMSVLTVVYLIAFRTPASAVDNQAELPETEKDVVSLAEDTVGKSIVEEDGKGVAVPADGNRASTQPMMAESEYGSEQLTSHTSPDVNYAILRALELRDSIRFYSGADTLDIESVDKATDRLLKLCKDVGMSMEELAFFHKTVRSKEFYEGKRIDFYIPEK